MAHFFRLFLFSAILFIGGKALANPVVITGTLTDTVTYATMQNASVSLIRAKDSVLQTFTRADENGKFTLQAPDTGKYIILVAHPSFADYIDRVDITYNTADIGAIQMTSKEHLLQEVIINDSRAITIKGDTTEYTADSFKVRDFANVDELLKKLPGIEVDKDGNITAHGEKVQKMYVDGEEFFADDPAMVAKTLRASAVDKVQVYDKKSDQAEFTGIDDGEKIKTINLKLKENAKKGYFGKISAGGGLPDYWENQAMINAFKGKRKIAAYATMSNTNTAGLDWNDNDKYGGGSNGTIEMSDDGYMYSSYTSDGDDMTDWGGKFNGQGLPKSWNAGALYSNKWFGDSLSFNGSYQYSKFDIDAFNNTRTQYILPDTQYVNNNYNNSFSTRQKHSANVTSEYKIDSLSSLKLTVSGNVKESKGTNENNSDAVSLNGDAINSSQQQQSTHTNSNNINATLLYRKKFKKEGRTLSISVNGIRNESENEGDYFTTNEFFSIGATDTVDQKKTKNTQNLQLGTKITYTEQLTKKAALELNYGLNINNNDAAYYTYDQHGNGQVSDVYNPLYSSDYSLKILTNTGGANVKYKLNDKINITIGGTVANSNFKQHDNLYDTTISYNYLNFFPRAIFRYSRNRQTNFTFSYSGSTQQPTLSQLQPLRDNTDQLNIMIGNPNLKQAFNHNFNLNYGDYKVLKDRYIWASLGASVIQDAISQSQNINDLGQRTYQYINMNGNYNAYGYVGYGIKIKPINLRTNFNFNANYSHANTLLNGLKSTSINQGYGPGLSLYYNIDTLLDISYNISVNYNRSTTSIRPDYINDYWSTTQSFNASYQFPHYFIIGTDVNWLYRQKIDAQDNNNSVFKWNAYVSKSFLKDHSLVLKLYVNDILNQNIGFQRNTFDNYITESSYNTIRRYGLLSLTWNFTHMGAISKGGAEESTEEPATGSDKQ